MAAPSGNRFWEARSKHGRKALWDDPDELFEACCDYFKWVEDNPLYESKPFAFQGQSWVEVVPKMRAMTIKGLCIFLGMSHETWLQYGKKEGFSEVVEMANNIIRVQKFTGAAADLLNASIISRDLGLQDATKVDNVSSDGSMSPAGNNFDVSMYEAAQSKLKGKMSK